MAIRLSGLTSGLDTDSIVKELVSAYSLKTQKYEKAQTKLTWKQDIWKSLNTKIYGLYTNVSNLRYSNAYTLRKTTVSDNTKASVTASSTAVTGTQTLKINKTAQASYITGEKIGTNVKYDTKMSELGYSGSKTSIEVLKKDGTSHEISISKSTTIQDVVNQFKEAGLNASFDEHNQRFFISAKESGEANDFNIYADYSNLNSKNALSALGLNAALVKSGQFTEVGAAKYQDAYDVYKAAGILDTDTDDQKIEKLKKYISSQIDDYNILKGDYNMAKNLANKYQEIMNQYDALEERYKAREAFEDISKAVEAAGVKVVSGDSAGEGEITEQTLRSMITRFNGIDATATAVQAAAGEGKLTTEQAKSLATIFNSNAYSSKMETIAEYTNSDLLEKSVTELDKLKKNFVKDSGVNDIVTQHTQAKKAFDNLQNTFKNDSTLSDNAKNFLQGKNLENLIRQVYSIQASDMKLTAEQEAEIEKTEEAQKDEKRDAFKEQNCEVERKKLIQKTLEQNNISTDYTDAIYQVINTDNSSDTKEVFRYQYGNLLDDMKSFTESTGSTGSTESTENKGIAEIESALIATQKKLNDLSTQMQENKFAYIVEDATDKNSNKTISEKIKEGVTNLAKKAIKANEVLTSKTGTSMEGTASKITGSDAEIELNGVKYTSSSNSFSINGLTIDAQATTTEAITITTSVDTQGIYDKIKDFLTEYNTVINEMCKLYNAESASDYEPLTDEEKEAMSEEQIEKWETKIKDSLLRRDSSLSSIMSGMVNAMAQTYNVNGTKLSLSSFGIGTLGFLNAAENEHYAYHIDGDEDDENTSEKDDELMVAIQEDPDTVLEFMKQLTSGLYSTIDNKMKSTELSSAYKVYNDKEMDSELADYAEMIKKWEEKVKEKEDFYYNKFSQMEVALSKLQNQTSSLSNLLGQ